ncbi:L-aspartate oxidase [Franzmannia pantelleriensis]|uniref:L-aspartate oxidase n=1 Tax=Franzmannia pantelleriensis TaxID=48727 RepID=A0A1G9M1E2_9GAMM|nr:L-aspartate oxidase [Halomonas pantelleriensis]SDL67974.1 L-aspartate oxidase [Halomonas pantelleriensis]
MRDVLIIGGGVAGLTLALSVAEHRQVTLLRPLHDHQGASQWAQGGIAAVLSPQDDIEAHIADTLTAGDGLCDAAAVRFTVTHGPAAIDWLLELGMPFTPDTSPDAPYPYHLTREGGHGVRRVIHADDATGRALIDTLLAQAARHPAITLRDDLTAVRLASDSHGRCCGAHCLTASGKPLTLPARDTVLASGGASGLYQHTTSPQPACGEGMLMAAELGAELMNLEFQQFHPTCLYDPGGAPFLISEALRGEGGVLKNLAGERFMPSLDPRGELAPRDIVARAIDAEMQREGGQHLWLDISHLPADDIRRQFPTIHAHCLSRGIDITQAPIPVVPAAHYSCGGIATDLHGASSVPHLYAIGESACTGLHGANRMASNSLLECLVFARAAAQHLLDGASSEGSQPTTTAIQGAWEQQAATTDSPEWVAERFATLRRVMSRQVGIVRSDAGLANAEQALAALEHEVRHDARQHSVSVPLARLQHALRLARLSVMAARQRRESRGLNFNRDCPFQAPLALASRLTLDDLSTR